MLILNQLISQFLSNILDICILIPAIAIIFIALLKEKHSRQISILSTGLVLAISLFLLIYFYKIGNVNITNSILFIKSLNINFNLGLNPISFVLFLMANIILFATALAGNVHRAEQKLSSFLIILFQISGIGLFLSLNLFIFFIFWDIGVISLFFMINILGSPNRRTASMKFLIYEIFASSLLLFGILIIYFYTPIHSFNIQKIITNSNLIPANIQLVIFVLLLIAFAINLPVFPFHSWLPDAHTEAPTQGSMLLSGILTKFGGFGIILLFEMLPIFKLYSNYIAIAAIVSIFYSVFVLMKQDDIKRVIAYSTITEMGIVLFGISELNNFGLFGSIYVMLSHGLIIALMFLIAGSIELIYGTRSIKVLKGIVKNARLSAYCFLIGTFAIVGMPLTTAFIADLLIFIGAIQSFGLYGIIPLFAILLLGAFMYFIINKSFLSTKKYSKNIDFIRIEQKFVYFILLFFIFLFGIFPFIILKLLNPI
ncbi:NADH-quinone oxidoreductase subunit M [Candidatus Marsarchaeota archaeon]|nr:NADH-quinone oxidoreductase subunit M [Candidatus Marsarchaeota archaeon]